MAEKLKSIVDRVLSGLLGDAEHAEKDRPHLMLDMLSDWLPYRVYDPHSRLYFNARSKGFVLSVTPLIGADERTGEILGQFFSEGLPAGACLQVLHLAIELAFDSAEREGTRQVAEIEVAELQVGIKSRRLA